MKAASQPLYHHFLKLLKQKNIKNKKLFIAVSGGVDSLSLLSLLVEASRPLNLKLSAGYVHHGDNGEPYRDLAQTHVYSVCQGLGVEFFPRRFSTSAFKINKQESEGALRKIRWHWLNQWTRQAKADYLTLAHTADDLLETRLIRLIRGTGAQGLESMSFLKGNILRPLIFFTKSEVKDYAEFQKIKWVEDPSNRRPKTLRNWIRSVWLPLLERKRKGSIRSLARSFKLLNEKTKISTADFQSAEVLVETKLDKEKFLKLSYEEQKEVLAAWMKRLGVKNYSQNHITEILKQTRGKKFKNKVQMLGRIWNFKGRRLSSVKLKRSKTPSRISVVN